MTKIEFIESYITPDDGGDYQWNDNHGRLIRCKDCGHYDGRPCGIVDWYNTANDYCSKAYLREGDSDDSSRKD